MLNRKNDSLVDRKVIRRQIGYDGFEGWNCHYELLIAKYSVANTIGYDENFRIENRIPFLVLFAALSPILIFFLKSFFCKICISISFSNFSDSFFDENKFFCISFCLTRLFLTAPQKHYWNASIFSWPLYYGLYRIRLGHCRWVLTFCVYLSPCINTSSCLQYITVHSYFLNSLLRYRYFWDTLYNSTLSLPINRIHLFSYLYFLYWCCKMVRILGDSRYNIIIARAIENAQGYV